MVLVKMSSLHLTTKQPTELLIYSDDIIVLFLSEMRKKLQISQQ